VVPRPCLSPNTPNPATLILFPQTNAGIVRDLAKAISGVSPKAHVLIISNPVNSTVPIAASVFQRAGTFDPARLFGVTTLDVVRSSRFLGSVAGTDPKKTHVTVVGGHSGVTIIPLLSQTKEAQSVINDKEKYDKLVYRIQYGGDEVVKAKDGAGSATLSMAYAGAKMANSLLRAMHGEKGIVVPTFVKSPLFEKEGIEFFSSNVQLGVRGSITHTVIPDPCRPAPPAQYAIPVPPFCPDHGGFLTFVFYFSPMVSRRSSLSGHCRPQKRSSSRPLSLS